MINQNGTDGVETLDPSIQNGDTLARAGSLERLRILRQSFLNAYDKYPGIYHVAARSDDGSVMRNLLPFESDAFTFDELLSETYDIHHRCAWYEALTFLSFSKKIFDVVGEIQIGDLRYASRLICDASTVESRTSKDRPLQKGQNQAWERLAANDAEAEGFTVFRKLAAEAALEINCVTRIPGWRKWLEYLYTSLSKQGASDFTKNGAISSISLPCNVFLASARSVESLMTDEQQRSIDVRGGEMARKAGFELGVSESLFHLGEKLEYHRLLFLHFADAMRKNPAEGRSDVFEYVRKVEQPGYDRYIDDIDSEGEFLIRNRRFLNDYAERTLGRFGYGNGRKPDIEGAEHPVWWLQEGGGHYLEESANAIRNAAAAVTALDTSSRYGHLMAKCVSITHDEGNARWYTGVLTRWKYLESLDAIIAEIKRCAALAGFSAQPAASMQPIEELSFLIGSDTGELKRHADELLWSVKLVGTLPHGLGEHQSRAYKKVCSRIEELAECLRKFSQTSGSEHSLVVLLRRAIQSLEVVGYDGTQCPDWENLGVLDIDPNAPTVTPDIPLQTIEMLEQAQTAFASIEEQRRLQAQAAIDKERADVLKAQEAECFIEYVRRNPGKGVLLSLGPIHIDEGFSFDMVPEYTNIIEIIKYPGERWIRWSERHHCEAGKLDELVEEIDEVTAAREILKSDVQADVETVIWAKQICAENPEPSETPASKERIRWDRDTGKLYLDGMVVRNVRGRKVASNVVRVLDYFQTDGWPERLDSPFPDDEAGKERLRETVRSLNKGLKSLVFAADGNGEGILLTIPVPDTTSQASPGDLPF